jgi:hypothetical protein
MVQRKVTLSLPTHTVTAAQDAARRAGAPFSAYVARLYEPRWRLTGA